MMSLLVVLLAGIAVALIRRRLKDPAAAAGRVDPPARLLGWAAGLLAAERHDWGQAMVGELDRLDGRARRWRFAIGCVGARWFCRPGGGPRPRSGG